MPNLRSNSISFLAGLLAAPIIAAVVHFKQGPPAVIGAPAPEIAHQKTEAIPTKSIQAYPDPAKRKLNLPADVQADKNDHVLGAVKVDADRPQTVTAVLDTETGKTDLYIRTDPLAWLATEKRYTFTADYGLKRDRDSPVWRAGARIDLLQAKALHFGLNGSIDGDRDWFVGVGLRWFIR